MKPNSLLSFTFVAYTLSSECVAAQRMARVIEGAAVRRALKGIRPSAAEMRGALCNGDGALVIIKEEKKGDCNCAPRHDLQHVL